MEKSLNKYKTFTFVVASVFVSVFALAGSALAQDCIVSAKTTDVGQVAVSADEFEAVKAGLGDWGRSGGRTYAEAAPVAEVGLSQVAAADLRAIRDLVAGNAEFSASGSGRDRSKTVSIGLAEVSRADFSGVRNGFGKAVPASTSGDCA